MFRKLLYSLKKCSLAICGGALLIAAGLVFHWFYVLVVGIIVAISTVTFIMEELIHGDGEEGAYFIVGFGLTALFVMATIFFHGERYISPHSNKQHLYSDCQYIIGKSSVKEVKKLEGFFYLTFSDCKSCRERRRAEKASIVEAEKQKERDELRNYLNDLIDSLENGTDPEKIKLQLQTDWGPYEDEDEKVENYHYEPIH